ncbi:hypothetical protein Dimus_038524 [Dionaea muscipula]
MRELCALFIEVGEGTWEFTVTPSMFIQEGSGIPPYFPRAWAHKSIGLGPYNIFFVSTIHARMGSTTGQSRTCPSCAARMVRFVKAGRMALCAPSMSWPYEMMPMQGFTLIVHKRRSCLLPMELLIA